MVAMNPTDIVRAIRAQAASESNANDNNQAAVAGLMAFQLKQHRDEILRSISAGPSSAALSSSTPPPGCPMHASGGSKFASKPVPPKPSPPKMVASSGGQCPIPQDDRDTYLVSKSTRPPISGSMATSSSASSSSSSKPWSSTLNPLNMMPNLGQSQAPEQKIELSTERVVSSIPRSRSSAAPGASPYDGPSACPVKHDDSKTSREQSEKWEYPSAQQFYNALVRKGWETPEKHVETMVMVHNFLNEQAWLEVLEWEKFAGADSSRAELARFQGKPGTLTPKARMYQWMAKIMPNTFSSEPPFDRHDWIVRRPDQNGKEVRYVIDYYSVPDDPEKEDPEFVLDIRPALDSVESLSVRFQKGFQEWKEGQGFFAAFAAENQAKPATATA